MMHYKPNASQLYTLSSHTSQRLTNRIKELAERYETPLPQIEAELAEVESKVNTHLEKMGFVI